MNLEIGILKPVNLWKLIIGVLYCGLDDFARLLTAPFQRSCRIFPFDKRSPRDDVQYSMSGLAWSSETAVEAYYVVVEGNMCHNERMLFLR